jgi:lipopolysaccharide export system protein LptC
MGERLTTWIPVTLIGILAALTLWLNYLVQPQPERQVRESTAPDYIVDNLTAVTLGETGETSYTLFAVKMVHQPEDDTTHLTDPRFVSFRSQKAPVTITSRRAVVAPGGEHVYFHDNVHLTRAAYDDKSQLELHTSFLHVIPEQGIARTDRPVTIVDATTVVDAVGLELNNETRVLKLHSHVRGIYDAAKAPRRDNAR